MRKFCPTWTDEQVALRTEWLHTCAWGAIRTAFDGFHTDDIHADLAQLRLRMRLVTAGAATVVLPEDVAEIQRLAPQIETRRVAGAGHMIPWDDLEGFLAAVIDFSV
jgi:N-formylmaleamate deformylase